MITRLKVLPIAKKPTDSNTSIPSDQATGYVPTMASNSQTAEPQTKVIGTVCYNEETQEYRYKCDREGCTTRKPMGRVQDLRRHFDDFHNGIVFNCPFPGCEYIRARKDKFKQHCREAHGTTYR
jgi:hypothetical protein